MGLRFKPKKIKPTKKQEENISELPYNFGVGNLSKPQNPQTLKQKINEIYSI